MKLGIVFAGQGSQKVGMGKDLYQNCTEFRKVFDLLSKEQQTIAFDGPAEALADTRNTQPIMLAFGAGVLAELSKAGIRGDMAAGLSLGEYTALHAAGVMDAKTAIEIVTLRAEEMSKASQSIDCKMYAVLNQDRESLKECCSEASDMGLVQIANYNCPGQIVIAGEKAAADRVAELAVERGARRCIPLAVSGPFHTKFMEPAGKALEKAFKQYEFNEMNFPVVFNAIGREKNTETIQELLITQVSNSVYFEDSIRYMESKGIDTIIEIGPGKALTGFVNKTCKNIETATIETLDDLRSVIETYGGRK